MNAKRGYVPEDEQNFSPAAIEKMRTASRHICYLIVLLCITGVSAKKNKYITKNYGKRLYYQYIDIADYI